MTERQIFMRADKLIREALVKEIQNQGHTLDGTLENSIAGVILQDSKRSQLIGTMLFYGFILNEGVKPGRVPYGGAGARTGAKTSLFIDGLTQYFIKRGLDEKTAKSAAFATAQKMKKEGMPTAGSYRFSKTGQRKKFIDRVADRVDQKLDTQISTDYDLMIDQQYRKTKSEII